MITSALYIQEECLSWSPLQLSLYIESQLFTADVNDVLLRSVLTSAWRLWKCIWETCVSLKEDNAVCVVVFCVGDSLLGIPREQSLYSMQHKHKQLFREESTSQSVPGLKREGFPSPITKTIRTHTHGQHVHLKAYRRRLSHRHAQGRRISSSHTLLSSVPSLCLFMMTPALIPSHSLSITSANSLSSLAETVFLLSLCFSFFPVSFNWFLRYPFFINH